MYISPEIACLVSVAANVTNKTEHKALYLTVYSIIMLKLLTIKNSC